MTEKKVQKLIFFDIDGTLLDDATKSMPESAAEAIRVARENGHICLVNTGRTKRMVGSGLLEQAEFDGYLMGCGTMIVYRGELLLHKTLTLELSERIMEALKRYHIDAILEGREENFIDKQENMYTTTFKRFAKGYNALNYAPYEEAGGQYDKLFVYADEQESIDAFRREFYEELDFIDRERGFYEVVPKGYSKATAMEYIADKLQIPMEHTVAIGDSNNDLPMLQCAHIGIAMGNSSKEVLEIADYITTDVDKDGIRNALKWLGVLD
ncbi:MAG: HAD family hydrolase [Lachnospiraceae bacterium]|nr:HAD family hydrolase [Lachnospiraceae bacterium]